MRAICFTYAILIAAMGTASAQIYRTVDKDGNVVFTDEAVPGATPVRIAPIQTYKHPVAPPAAAPAVADDNADEKAAPLPPSRYQVSIANPANDTTVFQNEGTVSVRVALQPPLAPVHRVKLTLNGVPVGEPKAGTSFTLNTVDRGSHTLRASVINQVGRVISSSPPAVFHLKRFFIRR